MDEIENKEDRNRDRNGEDDSRQQRDSQHNVDKFGNRSLDSSQNGSNESNDDDDAEGYGFLDKYNSMGVDRTTSTASDMMSSKTSFTSAYESTRSESPPSDNLFKSQQRTYTSGVSGGSSSTWMGPVYKTGIAPPVPTHLPPTRTSAIANVPMPLISTGVHPDTPIKISSPSPGKASDFPSSSVLATERNIDPNMKLNLKSTEIFHHDARGNQGARSSDLMEPERGIKGISKENEREKGKEHIIPGSVYRSGSLRSRSRSAGRWRADQGISIDLSNSDDKSVTGNIIGDDDDDVEEEEEDEEEGLAGGYDTT